MGGGPQGGAMYGEELTTLWIGSLPSGSTADDVRAAFSSCGQVVAATVQATPSTYGNHSGFVRFMTRQEAEMALAQVSGGAIVVRDVPCMGHWARKNSKIDAVAVEPAIVPPMTMSPYF